MQRKHKEHMRIKKRWGDEMDGDQWALPSHFRLIISACYAQRALPEPGWSAAARALSECAGAYVNWRELGNSREVSCGAALAGT
jgi:hypothetical protein